jgi:hypothetical protein
MVLPPYHSEYHSECRHRLCVANKADVALTPPWKEAWVSRPGEHVRPGGEIQFSKRPAITRNSRLGEAVRPRYAQLVKSTPGLQTSRSIYQSSVWGVFS